MAQNIDYNPLYASIAASSQNAGNAAFDAGYLIPEIIRESKNILGKAKDSIGNYAKDKKSKKKESTQMAQGDWFPGKHLAGALGGLGGKAMNLGQSIKDRGNPFTNQTGLFQGGQQGRPMGRFRDAMEGAYQAQRPGQPGFDSMSFSDAFRAARDQGLGEFNWQGKPYHTQTKEEMGGPGGPGGQLGPAGAGGTKALPQRSPFAYNPMMPMMGPIGGLLGPLVGAADDYMSQPPEEPNRSAWHYGDDSKSGWQNFKDNWWQAWGYDS